ncbi:MAG: ferritin [Sedimentisphaerales bacterium]|nr:ferritin [Sedimentisphaerales bacterium]
MISPTMQDAINAQINAEMVSAYLYLAMSAYFEDQNLPGFARWMKAQFQEEMSHADKLYEYLQERGGRVLLQAIAAPPAEFDGPLGTFQATLEHERKVTGLILNLVKLARKENDTATEIFLQWFVTEQVEEEKNAEDIIQQLKMVSGAPGGLFMLNRQLGLRPLATSAAAEAD